MATQATVSEATMPTGEKRKKGDLSESGCDSPPIIDEARLAQMQADTASQVTEVMSKLMAVEMSKVSNAMSAALPDVVKVVLDNNIECVIAPLAARTEAMEKQMCTMEAKMGTMDDKMGTLCANLGDCAQGVSGLSSSVSGIEQTVRVLVEKFDSLSARSNPVPSSPVVTPGSLSYAAVVTSSPPLAMAPPTMANSWADDVTTPTFNRKANPTKLFCNIHDRAQVSKAKFSEAILVLFLEANLKEGDVKILGDELDNRFELQFLGDLRSASVMALQFYQSLQLGRGKWKTQSVLDDSNKANQFYVAPDKNPCQMRREVLCKHLKAILGGLSPNKEFWAKKSTGTIYADKRVVATVQVTGSDTANILWCDAKRIECKLDKAEVELQFNSYVVSGGQLS